MRIKKHYQNFILSFLSVVVITILGVINDNNLCALIAFFSVSAIVTFIAGIVFWLREFE